MQSYFYSHSKLLSHDLSCYATTVVVTAEPAAEGLRERKKERTRELIAETARRLFVERGFERGDRRRDRPGRDVSEKTVFNYFPSKEDLVFWRLESFEDELLDAIRTARPASRRCAGFGRFVLQRRGLLADQDPAAQPPSPA